MADPTESQKQPYRPDREPRVLQLNRQGGQA